MTQPPDAVRRDELAAGLASVRARVERACAAAGREPAEVTLVVVTKTFPASDVVALAGLGVRDVGENRDQEAAAKVGEVASALDGTGVREPRWHFVGQLQRNKAGSVARYADVVHSVDRGRLAQALDRGAHAAGRPLEVLLQVNLDPDPAPGRGGARPGALASLAATVAGCGSLRLRGVMGVAPLGVDPGPAFDRLVALRDDLVRDHPNATWVSAGMSGDLEAAVAAGATHLRVGSAVLGSRASLR